MSRIIKSAYVNFLEKEKKSFLESFVFIFLYCLSLFYGFLVYCRNSLYDRGILRVSSIDKKVISVGNVSWGGCGKTSLVSFIHETLKPACRVASITKGYARDEFLFLKEKLGDVYDSKNRVALLKKLRNNYDVFILDDGFQYRKLNRDLDIVMMAAKEFKKRPYLLPADIFREPLKSIKRADMVVLNHWREISDIDSFKRKLLKINSRLKVYLADYRLKRVLDKNRRAIDIDYFYGKDCAVLSGIGYPGGFISLVKDSGIKAEKVILYPDHHEFSALEITKIEDSLKKLGINDIIITYKDFYHLDLSKAAMNYFIMDAELKIEGEKDFVKDIKNILLEKPRKIQ